MAPALQAPASSPTAVAVGPKSIILVLADGAGFGAYAAAFRASGESETPFARFAHVGVMTSHGPDGITVTDSAASATALATGVKVPNGYVGVDARGDSRENLLEVARGLGLATGLVATSNVTDATPAAFAAHVTSRMEQTEIMGQMLESRIDVLFGGGAKFLAAHRSKLTAAGMQEISHLGVDLRPATPVIGLFGDQALPPAGERHPTTTQMASRAIEVLEARGVGFVLVVEESQIDWAAHANVSAQLLAEMASFLALVSVLLDYQSAHPDTLLLVTSDHETGGVAVVGNEAGPASVRFSTKSHSANLVPIWASGPGAAAFGRLVDNAEVGATLLAFVRRRHSIGTALQPPR